MGSNYFGHGERHGSSSRKGKKSSADKPRQPQRGLGVAQLEKLRLLSQMASTYLPSLQSPFSANYDHEKMRVETSYSALSSPSSLSYSSSSSSYEFLTEMFQTRWEMSNESMDRQNLNMKLVLDQINMTKKRRKNSMWESNQISGTQELDLELRLSI